ncbi:MAG: GNAT family N-acetyltransferase [Gemmatimonadota bacterium]
MVAGHIDQISASTRDAAYALGVFDATGAIVREVEAYREQSGAFTLIYWLASHARGKGYMVHAVRRVTGALFALTDTPRVIGEVAEDNETSRRVLIANGFVSVPRTLRAHDAYAITREAFTVGAL